MAKAALERSRALLAGLALIALPGAAAAEPFDKTTCAALVEEQSKLEKDGVIADRERGPEWAKANLSAERVRVILHSIEVDEQLMFRCRIGGLTVAAKRAGEQADKIELNPNDPDAKQTKNAPGEKKAPARKSRHKNKTAPKSEAAADTAPEKPRKPVRHRKRAKPKHNDAYSPTASTSAAPAPPSETSVPPSGTGGPGASLSP